jgi:hypothetical protein
MTIVNINDNTYDTDDLIRNRGYVTMFPAMVNDVAAVATTASAVAVTGTSYTLILTNAGKILECSNAGTQTISIPTDAAVAFDIGSVILLERHGAGAVVADAVAGVTLNGVTSGAVNLRAQWSSAYLRKTAADAWVIFGDLV